MLLRDRIGTSDDATLVCETSKTHQKRFSEESNFIQITEACTESKTFCLSSICFWLPCVPFACRCRCRLILNFHILSFVRPSWAVRNFLSGGHDTDDTAETNDTVETDSDMDFSPHNPMQEHLGLNITFKCWMQKRSLWSGV